MALDLTKSSTAYIVKGGTGEYDDRTDWYVYATTSKPEALALHAALEKWCADNGCSCEISVAKMMELRGKHPPEDPGFKLDYSGTQYWIDECPIGIDPNTV